MKVNCMLKLKHYMQESAVFLLDLMCLLHEKAVGYYATFNNKSTIPIRREDGIKYILRKTWEDR